MCGGGVATFPGPLLFRAGRPLGTAPCLSPLLFAGLSSHSPPTPASMAASGEWGVGDGAGIFWPWPGSFQKLRGSSRGRHQEAVLM